MATIGMLQNRSDLMDLTLGIMGVMGAAYAALAGGGAAGAGVGALGTVVNAGQSRLHVSVCASFFLLLL